MSIFDAMKADALAAVPTDNELSTISQLVQDQVVLEQRIAKGEALLKDLKEQLDRLAEVTIPAAMAEVGLDSLTLSSGQRIEIKESIFASIRADKQDEAYTWLNEQGLGDIIKDTVALPFGRGDQKKVKELIDILKASGYSNFTEKLSIHPSTFRAVVRTARAQGTEFPEDYFSIADIKRSVIK